MVDIYRWHLANPGKQWPNLIYWGHYVAHDNNRDAMKPMTLQLTRNVLNTFVGWKAQFFMTCTNCSISLRQHHRRRSL